MYPRAFDYLAPASLEEAVEAMAAPGSKVLAGGMSLIPMMKLRVLSPATLVDLGRIPGWDEIRDGPDHLEVGALVRHRRIAADRMVIEAATALSEAASWTGDVQVRNRGTLCGSLAHADSSADQTAAALALGVTLVAHSGRGRRSIPVESFFVDAFTTALQDDEILTAALVPVSGPGEGSAYRKQGRRGGRDGFAVAGAAAWVKTDNGAVTAARVALTGVSTRPVAAEAVGEALIGTDGSRPAIEAAANRATEGVVLIGDLHGSEEYKAHLARLLTAEALAAAVDRARGYGGTDRGDDPRS